MRLALVFLLGGAGCSARYLIGLATDSSHQAFPWTTLAINVAGCFALGLLLGLIGARHDDVRAAVGTGFLGGWTTFSTFAVDADRLTAAPMAAYVALSVGAGIGAAALGRATA